MDICRICGAFLVVGDAQQRMDEHIMGKQHMGYARIMSYMEERKVLINICKHMDYVTADKLN